MFVRKKRNRSGTISVAVIDKSGGKFKEISHIGIARDESEVDELMKRGREWIADYQERLHPTLDFDGRAEAAKELERQEVERVVSSIENVLLNGWMHEIDKGGGRRLLVGYTDDRARKDSYNRNKGVRRLERLYKRGRLTKESINKRGYDKFLDMSGDTHIVINRERIAQDSAWDGLKGYLTNTDIPTGDVFTAYHNLWNVERAFRIAKSKIEIRPMFHFTRKRIEAHVCICFVALKCYKELERRLKSANIGMSVDKVLNMAKTVTTIVFRLPESGKTFTKTMPMKRHQRIAKLFTDEFWVTR